MLTLYTETTVEPPTGPYNRRAEFVIPRANGSYDRSKHSKRPPRHDRLATDDKSYAAEYLASASSVFFRTAQTSPRAFFWRVVAGERVLEIANADFSKRKDEDDSSGAVVALEFQERISPRGVSICDSSSSQIVHLFVLSKENEIFEIRLQPDWFSNPSAIPADTSKWCGPVRASALTIDKAFQIQAANPQDLFVSFASGKVQHWNRPSIHENWNQVTYDDKSWSASLFSIVARKPHPDVEYEGMKLAYNTAHALARCGQYLFTLCLNHTLRVWHLESGKLVDSRDLLNQAREPSELLQLKPAEPGYLQFVEGGNSTDRVLMSHSPVDGGQVKFWLVRNVFDDDTSQFQIEDMAPSLTLALPDPDPTGTTIWMLAGLKAVPGRQSGALQLWALWRNNNYHRSYVLNFQLGALSTTWQNNWVLAQSAPRKAIPQDYIALDAREIMATWSNFLFYPHRYSIAVLETALAQYSNALSVKISARSRNRSLRTRLQETIRAQVKERKLDNGALDNDRYLLDTDKQWRQFWRVVEVLNESRFAPLSLAADPATGMVVTPMTDSCSVVRESSNLELFQSNVSGDAHLLLSAMKEDLHRKPGAKDQEVSNASTILKAAKEFYDSFSPDLQSDFLEGVQDDIKLDDPSADPAQRVVDFFNDIDMANSITDEAEKKLQHDLGSLGAKSGLTNKHFDFVLKHLFDKHARQHKGSMTKTKFGTDLTFATLLETIANIRDVLLSLLAVVLFVDDTKEFSPAANFRQLVKLLKVQERNLWLATHTRSDADNHSETILQDIYNAALRPPDGSPLYQTLTYHVQDYLELISGDSTFKSEENAVYLQCWLIKNHEQDLAKDFLKFQPDTPWSSYIKGRLDLVYGDPDSAYKYFDAASSDLSGGGKVLGKLEHFSNGLLTADEAAHFYGGKPLYLSHIADLFESQKIYSKVALATASALAALKSTNEPKPNFQQGLLLRLFKANLLNAEFELAFDALTDFTDPVLQRASTTELIDTMLDKRETLGGTAATIKKIQSFDLSKHPQILATIDSHIAALAKKQAANPLPWSSSKSIDYIAIIYTLRLARDDYRGAMSTLFDRLRTVQKSGRARSDPKATSLRRALLALINVMTCVSEDEAYIIADVSEDPRGGGKAQKRLQPASEEESEQPKKRQKVVITLTDLRREYQNVLDRCSRIERGDFDFATNGDDFDEDEEDDGTWEGTRLNIDDNRMSGALFGNGGRDTMQID